MSRASNGKSESQRTGTTAFPRPFRASFPDRLAAKTQEFLDRFLCDAWLADTEQARQARLIARFGFLGLAFGILYALFYLVVGHYWGAGIILFCSAGFGSVPWVMRRTRNLKLAGNTLAAIMTVGFAALCCVEGGLRGHAVAWLASVPLCALLLVGKESARFWVYTCFAIAIALVAAEIEGISLPVTYDVSWNPLLTSAGYLGLIVFMFVLGLIFETGRERAFAGMQNALGELASSNEQLVILNKEKSEFLGIAAHDLRNPLSTIITFAQALERSDDPADVPTVCTAIQTAGTQMRDLIVNLIDSNAIEEGRFRANVERCELNALIARSVANNQLNATRKESVIVMEPSPQLWARADQLTTVQIFDNLISNAVKYSPPNSRVLVQASTEKDKVLVAVKDEGPGISGDDQAKLFGKFMRLTARPTAGESSTGLGLSIVKKLTEAMSGSVECRSVLGQGATFIVRLPAWDCGAS